MYLKNICFIKEMFLQLFNKYVSHKYVSTLILINLFKNNKIVMYHFSEI
jgi:hypothetical protein